MQLLQPPPFSCLCLGAHSSPATLKQSQDMCDDGIEGMAHGPATECHGLKTSLKQNI